VSTAASLAAQAGELIDLVRAPFTLPRSRLLVFREGEGLRVHTAEYERRLDECRVLDALVLRDETGEALPISRVLPHAIEFGSGAAVLGFAGPSALTVSAGSGALRVEWATDAGAGSAAIEADAGLRVAVDDGRRVEVTSSAASAADLAESERIWREWFARCPRVRDDLQSMTAFCWWVLGANIVELPALGDARAVVPSKIGYVGLWQWDAYFIAVGLRHGDPALAREQLELAFRFPTADGQLPDVVHEHGVLAGSDDLPEADRANLRRAGSAVADPSAPVPLTKPPLAAWALEKVLEAEPSDAWAREQLTAIRRSQDWWFAASDLDGDGMPEYGHPYSSGLDDSPVFDGPPPTTSPDLGAYLVVQDLLLAGFAERFGDVPVEPHLARAERTLELLLGLWDDEGGVFRARAAGVPSPSDAIVGLLPLLTGRLPGHIADRLVAALDDDRRFRARWSVPTVAVGDADFSPERMWRGPVWINTNALLVEGLRASGHAERARALAEQTVALVIHGGGPHEYFNPLTGQKAATATTAFGWSAALFVELAVQLSGGEVGV
jgi:glycogen debranching enzyme